MRNRFWRRWRPRGAIIEQHAAQPFSVFASVEARLRKVSISKRSWRKHQDFTALNSYIDGARGHAIGLDKNQAPALERAQAWLYALALQAPRAAIAQEQMDKHPHGYQNKEHRLFELIDFNDAFDSAIFALPKDLLPHARDGIRQLCDFMCKRAGTRCFSNEQFQAIVHGLSRETAVFIGIKEAGYEPEMTSRREDAFGIDMRIIDSRTMRQVNVDIKTRSSYHYRVEQLRREGRLSEEEVLMADRNGFILAINGRGKEKRRVVSWRIDNEHLGEVVHFRFKNTAKLIEMLQAIMFRYGERL